MSWEVGRNESRHGSLHCTDEDTGAWGGPGAWVGSCRQEVTEEGLDTGQAAPKPGLPSRVNTPWGCMGADIGSDRGEQTRRWLEPEGGRGSPPPTSPTSTPPGGGCQQVPKCVCLPSCPLQGSPQSAGPPGLRGLPRVCQPQPRAGPQVSGPGSGAPPPGGWPSLGRGGGIRSHTKGTNTASGAERRK